MGAYSFDVNALTQTIMNTAISGIQFWNVIPNRVESSVKKWKYWPIT